MTEFQSVANDYNVTRFAVPQGYPSRFEVTDADKNWDVKLHSYTPSIYTHPDLLTADYADPETITQQEIQERLLEDDSVVFNAAGRPLNPYGRTGIEGRGLLGRFGPNYLGLFVLTSVSNEVLVIERTDNGQVALPGGYHNPGETILDAATREAAEEIIPNFDPATADRIGRLFMLPDPKTTDNAWITAGVVSAQVESLLDVDLIPDLSEVRSAVWLPVAEVRPQLWPAHRHALDIVTNSLYLS